MEWGVVMSTANGSGRGISLGMRIFLLPLVVLALLVGIAYFSLYRLNMVKGEIDHIADYWLPATELVTEISEQVLMQRVHYERVLKLHGIDPLPQAELDRELQHWAEGDARVGALMGRAGGMVGESARLDSALALVEEVYRNFSGRAVAVMDLLSKGDQGGLRDLEEALDRDEAQFEQTIERVEAVFEHSFEQAVAKAEEHELGVLRLNLMITIVGAVFGVVFAALLTARMTGPLRRLMGTMRAVEQGHLDEPLPVFSNDEIGSLTSSFNSMVSELKLKDTIESTFGKYVDARIVQRLLADPEGPKTDGENQVMTVLFGDVVGFADATQDLSAEALVELTNKHLTQISAPVVSHGGVIDKYIGTMVMAFWGAPFTSEEEHARLACTAALEQVDQLDALCRLVAEAIGKEPAALELRVGLATGSLVVGNMGSERAKSYTVMGDTVNIASRLKGANKAYGTRILISEQTHLMVADSMETREIDMISVVGKDEPLRIYELIGEKGKTDSTSSELRDVFHEGLAAYRRQNWEQALEHFGRCALLRPDDGPTATYRERVEALRQDPPAKDWDGVWYLTQK